MNTLEDNMKYDQSVSIIFLCHNNSHIDISIDSAYEQLDADDEIIIVDDHSDRETRDILNKYSGYSQITLLNATKVANRSCNRNMGAFHAQNSILVFLDGDMVLGNNSIQEIKNGHCTRPERAFIGQKHGIHYDNIQMRLYSSMPNYIQLLKTKEGRDQLSNNPLFFDDRSKHFEDSTTENYRWTCYYTGLCSVDKDIFDQVEGFDENFKQWGSEDVDFGYRISKICKIGFLNNLHGFHIPHMRDILKNESTNLINIQYMQDKYKTWEFEIMQSFYGYGRFPAFEAVIARMRLLLLSDTVPAMENNSLLIDVISQAHPNGWICIMDCTLEKINSFLGLAIPVKKTQFHTAYVSDHIFIYPTVLTCRILQEALRVAEQVYIFPTPDSVRIPWDFEKILLPQVAKQHLYYEANDLLNFIFCSAENDLIKVTSIRTANYL